MAETKTTFTPGPWRAEPEDRAPDRGDVYIGGPKGWRHQPIAACCFPRDIEEAKANAALIAAAPDLYAAGEAICAAAAEVEAMLDAGEPAPDDSAMWEAISKMRAALARANGEG